MKKNYYIHRHEDKAETGYVDSYTFGCTYQPKTQFSLWYEEGMGFHLSMTCYEKEPKAIYRCPMDPVYKDSCMEFFVCFYPHHNLNYINFEMNANGALLANYHDLDSGEKVKCTEDFEGYVKSSTEDDRWHVALFIPLDFIYKMYKTNEPLGKAFLGNFYKCGDETESPHYGSWNKIVLEKPNFHTPQFFGNLILK